MEVSCTHGRLIYSIYCHSFGRAGLCPWGLVQHSLKWIGWQAMGPWQSDTRVLKLTWMTWKSPLWRGNSQNLCRRLRERSRAVDWSPPGGQLDQVAEEDAGRPKHIERICLEYQAEVCVRMVFHSHFWQSFNLCIRGKSAEVVCHLVKMLLGRLPGECISDREETLRQT